jgi:hypothetical protein
MGLRREFVRLLSTKIVEELVAREMIEKPEGLPLGDEVYQVIDAELSVEDRLNEEVHGMLHEIQEQMKQTGAGYQEMFKLLKNKLVRERKIIL